MLVKPRRAKASEAAHVQWVSDGNCTFTADQNADAHNTYGACRNPQTSIDCGQGVTVKTDVDLDPVDSIVDTAEVGVQTESVPTRVVWGGGDSQVTMEDLEEPLVCPLAGPGYTGLELAATLGKQSVFAYLDSGSTGNYISEKLAHQLGLVLTGEPVRLEMADKTTRYTLGKITNLRMRCGSVVTRFSADVFPGLSHDVLLGQPWLVKEDPRIRFRDGTVELQRGDTFHYLPTRVNLSIPTPKTVR